MKGKSDEDIEKVKRWRIMLLWIMITQGIVLPVITFILALTLATPENQMPFLWLILGGCSASAMLLHIYVERGTNGALEKCGAPVGWLGVTAVPKGPTAEDVINRRSLHRLRAAL